MPRYNIVEFRTHLESLINRALAGEEVIVTRRNKPLLKLVPIESPSRRRVPGSAGERVKVAADFDATPLEFEETRDSDHRGGETPPIQPAGRQRSN